MSKNDEKTFCLPGREISYAYTVAMQFGQYFDVNLRAILYAANYHGWGAEIELDKTQLKRFRSTEAFIDKATCGLIIEKLRVTGVLRNVRAWKAFERACGHRNKLAHSFLADEDFSEMTKQREKEITRRLHQMTLDLYVALEISRKVRGQAELLADENHEHWMKTLGEFLPSDYDEPNRHYSTRKRKNINPL